MYISVCTPIHEGGIWWLVEYVIPHIHPLYAINMYIYDIYENVISYIKCITVYLQYPICAYMVL